MNYNRYERRFFCYHYYKRTDKNDKEKEKKCIWTCHVFELMHNLCTSYHISRIFSNETIDVEERRLNSDYALLWKRTLKSWPIFYGQKKIMKRSIWSAKTCSRSRKWYLSPLFVMLKYISIFFFVQKWIFLCAKMNFSLHGLSEDECVSTFFTHCCFVFSPIRYQKHDKS
jgi:hypothetical protein